MLDAISSYSLCNLFFFFFVKSLLVLRAIPSQALGCKFPDCLQTHHLCYLFGRATKSVSICPPAYYADLLCTRGRCYLMDSYDGTNIPDTASVTSNSTGDYNPNQGWRGGVHEDLKDTMFYI